jgi:hypothetical protein
MDSMEPTAACLVRNRTRGGRGAPTKVSLEPRLKMPHLLNRSRTTFCPSLLA